MPGSADIKTFPFEAQRKAELDVLLECAQIRPPAELESLLEERRSGDLDWNYILETAARHGVLPLVYRNIRNSNTFLVPDPLLDRTRRTFHAWGLQVHFLMAEVSRLLDQFSGHDIRAMLFKGPALGVYAFGDASLRKPGDIDMFVPREEFSIAGDLLVARGYRPEVDAEHQANFLKARKGITFYGDRCDVDLHWTLETERFDTYPLVLGLDPRHVWERRIRVRIGSADAWTLCPEDHLLYLSAHGTKHSWSRLYLMADVAELIRSRGDVIDWQHVLERAERFGNQRILVVSLLLAAGLLNAPLPPSVRRRAFADQKAIAMAAQVSHWLFNPERNGNGPSELDQHLFRLRSREKLTDKASYIIFRAHRACSRRLTHGSGLGTVKGSLPESAQSRE